MSRNHKKGHAKKAGPHLGLWAEIKQKGFYGAMRSHTFHIKLRWMVGLVAIVAALGFLAGVEFLGHISLVLALDALVHHAFVEALS